MTSISGVSQKSSLSFYVAKIPHVCGGWSRHECFRYVPTNDTWVVSGMLQHKHIRPGYTYHNEFGLVITGGNNHRINMTNIFNNLTIQVSTCIKAIQNYEKEELGRDSQENKMLTPLMDLRRSC